MLQSRLAGFLAGLVILAVLWLVIASAAFLWLSGLWDDPRLVWWSRPWIWATYALRGDGSFSEWLYLIAAAVIASMPAVALRALCRLQPGRRPAPPFWAGAARLSAATPTTTAMPIT